jgi:hypothetical protein
MSGQSRPIGIDDAKAWAVPLGSSTASAAVVATSGTITTTGAAIARVAPAGAVTGVILQAGVYDGQLCIVRNESAFSVTMAIAGTSNVADGVSAVIAALTQKVFTWSAAASLWFHD